MRFFVGMVEGRGFCIDYMRWWYDHIGTFNNDECNALIPKLVAGLRMNQVRWSHHQRRDVDIRSMIGAHVVGTASVHCLLKLA